MSTNKKEMIYIFRPVTKCNMCQAGASEQKKMGRRLNKSVGMNPRKVIGIATTVMKCRNCGLIYSNPQPVPYDLAMHYDMPVTEYYSPDFLDVAEEGLYYKGQLDFISIFKNHYKGTGRPTVLDIGAGIGNTLLPFKKAGFDIYGLEPSTPFYKKAEHYLGEDFRNMQNVAFEDAQYADGQFDFIYSFNVLEHVYDPNQMIVQAMKWMKPGGLLGLVMPSSAWLTSKIINLYFWLGGSDMVTNISPMHYPFHLYEFGKKSFYENARINNYEVLQANSVTTSTHLPRLLDPVLLPLMRATDTGLRLEVVLRKKA